MQLLKQIPMQTMCGRTHLAVWRNTRITQCGFIREPGPQKTERYQETLFPKGKKSFLNYALTLVVTVSTVTL